jgi:hypothetical protein
MKGIIEKRILPHSQTSVINNNQHSLTDSITVLFDTLICTTYVIHAFIISRCLFFI